MSLSIHYNDAWESVPLDVVDDFIAFLDRKLQPAHPLRGFKLFPLAKCSRKDKYLVEEEEPSDLLWVLDLEKKIKVRGKTFFYFKQLNTQEELDALLQADLNAWIKETLKNDSISLASPSESVFFDLAARFNRFLGSFWAL